MLPALMSVMLRATTCDVISSWPVIHHLPAFTPSPSSIGRRSQARAFRRRSSLVKAKTPAAHQKESPSYRFINPYEELKQEDAVQALNPDTANSPLMLYLPGMDGTGFSAFTQFPFLSEEFDLTCLSITANDRSTVQELVQATLSHLHQSPPRPFYLLGESFGAVVALLVAHEIEKAPKDFPGELRGVIIVNPATSFLRSWWRNYQAFLDRVPSFLFGVALLPLVFSSVDVTLARDLVQDALMKAKRIPRWLKGQPRKEMMELQERTTPAHMSFLRKAVPIVIRILTVPLPPDTFRWRLREWLREGATMAEPILPHVHAPVLIVAGEGDRLLPSREEGERLLKVLPNPSNRLHSVRGGGHAGTLNVPLNLRALIRDWEGERSCQKQEVGASAAGIQRS
ncbi:unnamed protein product [Vitrella brassicaformis CCMP3155]|uniref:AB hydrolase-1 domain-containing protein n=1 Tax=Vitrella brassicaformis (strain CCMP3155) TaxID=1169540 RepID=A0A0G4EQ17_VITBC|nr:unnamed protein product [Vitrella brassicaformis CCMP3155]|eukprot:CEL99693.1 unnamed protein product [Vitrella brassicaformis CCMP3155]